MRDEMDVAKLARIALRIRGGHRLCLAEYSLAIRRKVLLNALHLGRCVWECRKFSFGLQRIADQKEIAGGATRRRGAQSGKNLDGTGGGHGNVFDPVFEA